MHFEIPTENLERAQKFYRDTFGWQMNAPPGEPYVMVSTVRTDPQGAPAEPGGINGGMLKRQAPIQNVVITINVANMDAALKKIQKMGGQVVRGKLPVGQAGFAAYFKDPEGNVVGLWEAAAKK